MCVEPFLLEILKNGTIIQSEDLRSQRAYYVFGRLPTSNFVLEHPSISRYEIVLFLKYKMIYSFKFFLYTYSCTSRDIRCSFILCKI